MQIKEVGFTENSFERNENWICKREFLLDKNLKYQIMLNPLS